MNQKSSTAPVNQLIQRLRAKTRTAEFLRFVLVGIANTGITYLVFVILSMFIHYTLSYTTAYLIGIFLSYFLNTHVAFGQKPSLGRLLAYPLVYVIQYVAGILLLQLFVEVFSIHAWAATPMVIIATLPLSFILSRIIITTQLKRG